MQILCHQREHNPTTEESNKISRNWLMVRKENVNDSKNYQ